jgi:hypothetical protein
MDEFCTSKTIQLLKKKTSIVMKHNHKQKIVIVMKHQTQLKKTSIVMKPKPILKKNIDRNEHKHKPKPKTK